MKKVSRRSFLQGSGLLAAAALGTGLTGCKNTAASSESQTEHSSTTGHEALTMTAMVPFRNPIHLEKLVQETYPVASSICLTF